MIMPVPAIYRSPYRSVYPGLGRDFHGFQCLLILNLFILTMIGCNPSVRYSAAPRSETPNNGEKIYHEGQTLSGTISYYAQEFHGRKTANGEIFNMYDKTAAHLYLPFNSVIQVTNTRNGRSVVVRINDRGPYKSDRILDLSYQAAKEIDLITAGTTRAIIKIISLGRN